MKNNHEVILSALEKRVEKSGMELSISFENKSDRYGVALAYRKNTYEPVWAFPFQIDKEQKKMQIQMHKNRSDGNFSSNECLHDFHLNVSHSFFIPNEIKEMIDSISETIGQENMANFSF